MPGAYLFWKHDSMNKTGKPTGTKRKGFTPCRKSFEKISAVEGIRLTGDMQSTFRALDKQGASAVARVRQS
jgi:hypothetical protein